MNKIYIVFCLLILSLFNEKNAKAVRIVATVENRVITDYDVEEFIPIICFFENQSGKCNKDEKFSIALMTLIETNLKQVHMSKIKLPENILDEKSFESYKKAIFAKKDITKLNKDLLNDYLKSNYIWQIIINSQIRDMKISYEEKNTYAQENNIKLNKNNEAKIEEIILQRRSMELSQALIEKMKKFYLIDIKI